MTSTGIDGLLALQEHDKRIDQLRHRLANLAERVSRDAAATALDAVDAEIAALQQRRSELGRDQKRLEDEVASIEAKRSSHTNRLYGGTVTNARELQDLQDEVDALGRRIEQLEDGELELMEQIEPIDSDLGDANRRRSEASTALDTASAALGAAEADIEAELAESIAARVGQLEGVPADLVARYEKIRTGLGGIGIARLVGNQCGGCHLTLSAVEVATLRKHPDELGQCEECGRLLVP